MISSGTTALSTSSDTVVQALAANTTQVCHHLRVANLGSVQGFYSIDGGTTWACLPANTVLTDDGVEFAGSAVQIKRVAGGSNLDNVYVSAW